MRLIVAADQNIVFDNVIYGKTKSIEDARNLICRMMGLEEVYVYTENSVLLANKDKILQSINITDTARLSIDTISDKELETYLLTNKCLTYCSGIQFLIRILYI